MGGVWRNGDDQGLERAAEQVDEGKELFQGLVVVVSNEVKEADLVSSEDGFAFQFLELLQGLLLWF